MLISNKIKKVKYYYPTAQSFRRKIIMLVSLKIPQMKTKFYNVLLFEVYKN